ncbi:MAG: cation:dicarboxylase symporter family transporter [Spirochaetes bacterium]|nr:cation:dicarboxylase symporter family transporter [Spirochaetota bacterium]
MKLWIKYLIASVLGLAIGLFTPIGGPLLDTLSTVAVNMVRVMLVPLLLFSIPVAVHELHGDRKLLRTLTRTTIYSLLALLIFTLLGSGGAILFSTTRIPLGNESGSLPELPTIARLLETAFPANIFGVIASSDYLLPVLLLGLVLGLAFSSEKNAAKPVLQLSDSLSRLSWQINSFILELFPLPLVLLSAARIGSIKAIPDLTPYARLFSLLGIEVAIALIVLLPLVIFIATKGKNPLRILYALIAPAITAVFTANYYAPAGILARHLKESLGVRRRVGSVALPLAMMIGRPGTALVSASSFIIILNSYSSLGLGPNAFLWILGMVPLSVLLSTAAPAAGPAACTAFLCASYGKGFESGYLLILPIALPLQAIATFLDVLILGTVTYLTAVGEHEAMHKEVRHYI